MNSSNYFSLKTASDLGPKTRRFMGYPFLDFFAKSQKGTVTIFRCVFPVVFINATRRGFLMSQNTTKFARCYYFKLTTCFGPCSGPSSQVTKLYIPGGSTVCHKIYQYNIYLCDLKMAQSRGRNMSSD